MKYKCNLCGEEVEVTSFPPVNSKGKRIFRHKGSDFSQVCFERFKLNHPTELFHDVFMGIPEEQVKENTENGIDSPIPMRQIVLYV